MSKKSELKSKSKQFPKNLRFITDNSVISFISSKNIIILAVIASLLMSLAIFVVGLDLANNYIRNQKIERERESIEREIKFWESVVREYSGYRDAYFKLAVLNYRIKNIKESRENLKKTLEIDPSFKEGREFEKVL